MKNIEKKNVEANKTLSKKKICAIYLQLILTLVTVVLFLIYLFTKNLFMWFQFALGVDLVIMAYNNQSVYQKKYLTVVYAIVGFALILLGILSSFGVVL